MLLQKANSATTLLVAQGVGVFCAVQRGRDKAAWQVGTEVLASAQHDFFNIIGFLNRTGNHARP